MAFWEDYFYDYSWRRCLCCCLCDLSVYLLMWLFNLTRRGFKALNDLVIPHLEALSDLVKRRFKALSELVKRRFKGPSYKDIKFLNKELRSINAALCMVGGVPPEQLPPHVKDWADQLRKVSSDTEDVLDSFQVRVDGLEHAHHPHSCRSRFVNKLANPFNKDRARIADAIADIKITVQNISHSYPRYDFAMFSPDRARLRADPAVTASQQIIGVSKAMDELLRMLRGGDDDVSHHKMKIVSLVGPAGVGKTTLAYRLYLSVRRQFDCSAFVSMSPNPDMKDLLSSMLHQLGFQGRTQYLSDQSRLIDELKEFLYNKRFLIVVDGIWDKTSWLRIKNTLKNNNLGSRIITTTRKLDVAEEIGGAYKVQPLSDQSARILFCQRIFAGDECPNELADISSDILMKCGGIPLFIVTVANLLTSGMIDWPMVNEYFGEVLFRQHHEVGNIIREELRVSYNNIPFHLRRCLLSVTVFPEDYMVRRDQLVWMWISEGFVQEKHGSSSLFEVGQSYFDELLNSSMIEEVDIYDDSNDVMVKYCCMCRVVRYYLILCLSSEENFVHIHDGRQEPPGSGDKVRRLSLHNGTVGLGDFCLSQVRSVTAFGPGGSSLMPEPSRFHALRVMVLEGLDLQGYNLKDAGKLLQLRYLGLRDSTSIDELPEETWNLQFLLVLDLRGTRIRALPSSISRLRRLLCLLVECTTTMPKRGWGLTSLEELSKISIGSSPNVLKDVASLTELRALDIVLEQEECYQGLQSNFLWSLSHLPKLQTLRIWGTLGGLGVEQFLRLHWRCPRSLRRFVVVDGFFSALPPWITWVVNLSELHICLLELWREGLQALGGLPELRFLRLTVQRMRGKPVVEAGAFPSLRELRLLGETCPVFRPGGAPQLSALEFILDVDTAASGGELEWGLGNLASLERVTARLHCASNDDAAAAEAEAALRHAADTHPSRPTVEVSLLPSSHQGQEQQQFEPEVGRPEDISVSSAAGPSEIEELPV
ncbi:hypothetical protein ACP4OV_002207 [Aristida adscensionis]